MSSYIIIDIERRVELAALELLADWSLLTAITEHIVQYEDLSQSVEYPTAYVQAIGWQERGMRTGWYEGALQIGGVTYRPDDKRKTTLKRILGALTGWAQQTDLMSQLTATDSAKATATALTVEAITEEIGMSVESEGERVHRMWRDVSLLARPSR